MNDTTTMTVPAPAHVVEVVSDGFEYLAECGCGWASDWQHTPADADVAGLGHRDGAVGPPDQLDAVMTELLDLQGDLAAVVVWLAENWSAHLPAPSVYSFTNYDGYRRGVAGVTLLVYCDTPDALTAVAGRLGVAVVPDAAPTCYGTRYQRAIRRFGRARIDAYTDLATESAL
jgi:hypothetical protein